MIQEKIVKAFTELIKQSSKKSGGGKFVEGNMDPKIGFIAVAISIAVYLVMLLLFSLFGKLLWNYALAGDKTEDPENKGIVTVFRKCDSFVKMMALFVFCGLLFR